MPRAQSPSRSALVDRALTTFWKTGYHVVSIGDLVRETGVSRAGIYSDFKGKEDLFHACLERYQETVVTPAFAPVEADGAGLKAIRTYLDHLLDQFEAHDTFGTGCLVLNTLAQVPPEDLATRRLLSQHMERLTKGLRTALSNEANFGKTLEAPKLTRVELEALASFTLISIQGLWSFSRTTKDVAPLRQYSDTLLALLHNRLHNSGTEAG